MLPCHQLSTYRRDTAWNIQMFQATLGYLKLQQTHITTGKLLNLPQDLLLLYVQRGGLGGSQRAVLSGSISSHIQKFLTVPLILKKSLCPIFVGVHIRKKTLHRKNLHLHSTHNSPAARGEEGGEALLLPSVQEKASLLSYKANK